MVAAFRLVITALQQLFERLGNRLPRPTSPAAGRGRRQCRHPVPVEGHDGDVEARVAKEGRGNIESIRQPRKYNWAWGPGTFDRIRL